MRDVRVQLEIINRTMNGVNLIFRDFCCSSPDFLVGWSKASARTEVEQASVSSSRLKQAVEIIGDSVCIVSHVLPVGELFYANRFETYDLQNIDLRFKTDLIFACKLIRGFEIPEPS